MRWGTQRGDHDLRIDELRQRGDRVAVVTSWLDSGGGRHHWPHVLRVRDGKIVDMRDYPTPEQALRAVR
jgi:ketosteroid isomerase-like protein